MEMSIQLSRSVPPAAWTLALLMLGLTFLAGWLLSRTGIPWTAAAALQLAAGILLALLFRFIEPLSSLKLITGRFGTA